MIRDGSRFSTISKTEPNLVVSNGYPISHYIVVDVPSVLDSPRIRFFCCVMNHLLKDETEKNITIPKIDPSNILVNRIKSIVKLVIFVLSFVLKAVLPNSKVSVSEKLVRSNNVWSMLTKLLRSV